ncbi:ATP-binding protein [Desulfoluna sp.]|uniref:ATP-binding protein n=1 Tax=Desulfoluna sp. TaxID=2045199 RepID=UPI00263310B7|nr:ATP-binding protein [Desulfoluna sp.]
MNDVQLIYHLPAALTLFTGVFLAMISVAKGRFRAENLLFPLICLLWSMNAVFYFVQFVVPVEMAGYLARLHGILSLWVPLVHLHFLYRWFDLRNARVERLSLIATLGLLMAGLTPWHVLMGSASFGGVLPGVRPFFCVNALFSGVMMIYLVRLCIGRLGLALAGDERRNLWLVAGSLTASAVLISLSMISFEGMLPYSMGNYLFLPMLVLAYAVFRYRMLHLASLLHLSLAWGLMALLIFVPNLGVFYLLRPWFHALHSVLLFLFFLCWFYMNYRYSRVIQAAVQRLFNRQYFDFKKVESHFSENILLLRRTDEMIHEFRRTVEGTLRIRGLVFFTRKGEGFLEEDTGRALELSEVTHRWLSLLQAPLDRREVERRAGSREVRREVAALLDQCGCDYIVSLSRYGELLGLVLFPEKGDLSGITLREERFISRIKEFVSIALYNSTVYQNLSRLQEELSRHTDALAEEVVERKRAQDVAEQSEKRSRLLAENVMDTLCILSIDPLAFTYLSPSVLTLLGYEEEELLHQDVRAVLTDYSEREIRTALTHALTAPQRHSRNDFMFEAELRRKDGSRVWSEVSARFLRDGDGRAREIFLVSRDITERRCLEREREGLQRKLRQAQKMESIGVLAGGIAHDFNNILMAMMGYTRLALMYIPEDNPKARDKIMQIDKAGQRARDLVAQILAFSRQNEQKREPCYLGALIKDTVAFLSASLPSNIDVRFTSGEGKLRVVADSVQIHQIIINLATNAFHAIGEEGGKIEIHADEVALGEALALALHLPEGPYVRLAVSDTGHGVDPEIASRIFEPYYTTKEVGKGTGMGLAVVHGIVLNHGGAVSLESERGQGATFQVYLPLADLPENAKGRDPALDRLETRGTVLLMDEDEIFIDLAREVLRRLGYQVEAFTDAQKALVVFGQWPKKYVAVVMDFFMGGIGGGKMARSIRDYAPAIPLVVTSGRPEPLSHTHFEEFQGVKILMKPFTLKELAEVLEQVIV